METDVKMMKEEYELCSKTDTSTKHKLDASLKLRAPELSRSDAEDAIEVLSEDEHPPKSQLRQAAGRRAVNPPIRRPINDIRKTRSSALAAAEFSRRHRQSRAETVSSPDFTDNGATTDEEPSYDGEQSSTPKGHRLPKLNRLAICFDNLRCICMLLNAFVLIFAGMYFACALTFSVSESAWLIVSRATWIPLACLFYAMAVCLCALAASGFYLLWRVTRKMKSFAVVTLIFGALNATAIFYLDSAQAAAQANVESRLAATTSRTDESTRSAWDQIHTTFACCGVNGFLDWCRREDRAPDSASDAADTDTARYVGTYVCSIPQSCCKLKENAARSEPCSEQLSSGELGNSGCAPFIKREIYYTAIMYKVISGSAATALILLGIMTRIMLAYIMK